MDRLPREILVCEIVSRLCPAPTKLCPTTEYVQNMIVLRQVNHRFFNTIEYLVRKIHWSSIFEICSDIVCVPRFTTPYIMYLLLRTPRATPRSRISLLVSRASSSRRCSCILQSQQRCPVLIYGLTFIPYCSLCRSLTRQQYTFFRRNIVRRIEIVRRPTFRYNNIDIKK